MRKVQVYFGKPYSIELCKILQLFDKIVDYLLIKFKFRQQFKNTHNSISLSKMNKTFSIENMQTYFRNYVPCKDHRNQPITNFCTQRICLKFMCPECVQNHSRSHANHPIQSIKTCIKKSSATLQRTIKQLQQESNNNNFLKYKTPEQYQNQLIRQLQQVRKGLVEDINQYFKEKEHQIRRQTSKTSQIKSKLQSLQTQLAKAVAQLKLLDKNLFINQECVGAIKKSNKIDYQALLQHFRQKIYDVQNEMDVNLKIQLNPSKRQQFRRILNNLIGIRNNKAKIAHKNYKPSNTASRNMLDPYRRPTEQDMANSQRVQYVVNPPPLSADRLLNQAAFKIQTQNYFQSQPFLHFFQVSKSCIHILRLKQLQENQSPRWVVIPLQINFPIPSFHRTIATQNGNVYLIGGTITNTLQKSKTIYQFDPIGKTLKEVSRLNVGRSSHSIVCLKKMIYITGGMSENDIIPKKCQLFNSRTNQCKFIASCKYATINSTLCFIGKDNLIKLGGVDGQGKNSEYIQIYNIPSDIWGEIDPTIQPVKGQFGLLSCSGWATLNQDQVFIFGGYNEQADNQNSKMTYVLEYNKEQKEYFIKYVNLKNLPLAQGFWNPQSIVHNKTIYALQNVDGQEDNDCLQDKRTLLIFNGKYWSSCVTSD